MSNICIKNESKGDGNQTLCLNNIINNLKKSDTWKIRLTMRKDFISSIDNDEEHVMHSKNDNVEIITNDEANKVIN